MAKLVSLCIPTNGIVKWVLPVIESIYKQNVEDDLFEIVITDNGTNSELKQHLKKYLEIHDNLIYKKTEDYQFLNQISCFKAASGELIKFINHRMVLKNNFLETLINYVKYYSNEKPMIYFLNGELKLPEISSYTTFNEFVYALSYWSSWSAGLCLWKRDFDSVYDKITYNTWFPHINLLFGFRDKTKYIIDNEKYLEELPTDESIKGKYNYWKVFFVEYLDIILELYKNNDITYKTFNHIRHNEFFWGFNHYLLYVKKKHPCSYDIDNVEESFNVFYGKYGYLKLQLFYYIMLPVRLLNKLLRLLHLKK